MEAVVRADHWRGRRVFVTGHTGFKGGWLALWLAEMGAEVTGFALPPPAEPSLFVQAGIAGMLTHVEGDIRDLGALRDALVAADPEVVLHLAAQPLVRHSYDAPVETYATNVMGTVHLLEACRAASGVRAVVCVTSDKCYENREWAWPYREIDPMGGYDPYSSSKGAAEIVIAAYRRSFFSTPDAPLVASVRAGNVIGGGDWATDRLVPDIVRALIAGERPVIRSPRSVRPWQHVLEAIGGYLVIAQRLLAGDAGIATGWNFGPDESDARPVRWIADRMVAAWGAEGWIDAEAPGARHEAKLLRLDCAKARAELGWRPSMTLAETLASIVAWHRAVASGGDASAISRDHLALYRDRMQAHAVETCA